MRLLVLGGGRFLGRHLVDAALVRGDQVTTFTRGREPNHWGNRVTALVGNRDPAIAPGLAALSDGRWDAVIDTSGYVPRIVRTSAALLADRVDRYLFVSSISVYADASRPGLDESGRVAVLDDPATEEIPANYGALKAACESVVNELYGERAINVRPGLIVGPLDFTDRFGYWVARFRLPQLLGDRADAAVVPLPALRPVQFIDARDLAHWMLELVSTKQSGTYNATSPVGRWNFSRMIFAMRDGLRNPPTIAWTHEALLLAQGVAPWSGLPLWLDSSQPDADGFMQIDCSKAENAGLRCRPLENTIADTAAWLAVRDQSKAWSQVLSADAERAVLALRDTG